MGKIKEVLPVKVVFSLITNSDYILNKVEKILEKEFGIIEFISEKFIFNHTDYYTDEMGEDLFRKFIVIKKLFKRENIAKIKIRTNNIEFSFSENNKRKINIDPGYVTLENFILFTTKNYTHRIYLQNGIYADLTLIYHKKDFHPLPWTYPDYSSEQIRKFLIKIRESYKNQLNNKREEKDV